MISQGGRASEEGRMLDVGGCGVPGVELTLRGWELVPIWVAGRDPPVHLLHMAKMLWTIFQLTRHNDPQAVDVNISNKMVKRVACVDPSATARWRKKSVKLLQTKAEKIMLEQTSFTRNKPETTKHTEVQTFHPFLYTRAKVLGSCGRMAGSIYNSINTSGGLLC